MGEEAAQQRRGCGAVNVVVAEQRNGLALPQYDPEEMPSRIPHEFQGATLIQTIFGPGNILLFYGKDYGGARYVVGIDPSSNVRQYAFDFANFLTAPGTEGGCQPGKPPEPVAWTNAYKGGRVFYTSLGHPDDFKTPQFKKLLANAVLWAADKPIPAAK